MVGNVLFDAGWEIAGGFNSEPRIFELANVETQLRDHRVETGNPELHVGVLHVHLIISAIADKEIENRQMLDTIHWPPRLDIYSKELRVSINLLMTWAFIPTSYAIVSLQSCAIRSC